MSRVIAVRTTTRSARFAGSSEESRARLGGLAIAAVLEEASRERAARIGSLDRRSRVAVRLNVGACMRFRIRVKGRASNWAIRCT
jgi:hypothetical protein